jgi:hypothetical protein
MSSHAVRKGTPDSTWKSFKTVPPVSEYATDCRANAAASDNLSLTEIALSHQQSAFSQKLADTRRSESDVRCVYLRLDIFPSGSARVRMRLFGGRVL